MLKVGLCSVTFKNLSAFEVIKYCKECKIDAIEWASNAHAPLGDTALATRIKEECDKEGIAISSYGTYYRCGKFEDPKAEFAKYIEIAKCLGAPKMRIWVGGMNFEDADSEHIAKIVDELKMICDMAKKENLEIGCEHHPNTLCNSCDSSLEIARRVDKDNFGMYFQHDWHFSLDYNFNTLKSFAGILKNVHVFNVDANGRYSIGEKGSREMWERFVQILNENNIKANLLLEFLPEETFSYLKQESEILREIINKTN